MVVALMSSRHATHSIRPRKRSHPRAARGRRAVRAGLLLFSGGKDSIVTAWLARKAFFPARVPFPLLHIDTGHNFPETLDFRDRFARELGCELIVRGVQDSIDSGRVEEETGRVREPNALQTVTLLDAIAELRARRRHRRRPPRRRKGARQGADLLASRPSRPMGSEKPAARVVESL